MTALQIIKILNSNNIELSLTGGLLKYTAPAGTMTDETIRLLKGHKVQLIEALRVKQTASEITIQKMSKCLHGKPCRFISLSDDRQICSKNNQPIFDMDACPDGKWERSQDKQKAQKKTMTCYSCGGQTFWRAKNNQGGLWICSECHPPVLAENEVEYS